MCKEIKRLVGREPSCETCTPSLWPINHNAAKVYLAVQDQVIISPGGLAISINQEAIHRVMELFKVPRLQREECFYKVVSLSRTLLKEARDNARD